MGACPHQMLIETLESNCLALLNEQLTLDGTSNLTNSETNSVAGNPR